MCRKIVKWVYGLNCGDSKSLAYILVCLRDKQELKNDRDWQATRVYGFNTLEEANSWVDLNVAKVERDYYEIYRVSKLNKE